jgi:hypothetical protein
MSTVDLLAYTVNVYADPGDYVTISVDVPFEFEPGTWVGKLWDSSCQGPPLALFTVFPPSNSPVILELDTSNPLLVPPWASSFRGHWELDRTVGGKTRTWVKGDFILDVDRRQGL